MTMIRSCDSSLPFVEIANDFGKATVCLQGAHPTDKSAPSHGFARTRLWQPMDLCSLPRGATQLRLRLTDGDASSASWPHRFTFDYCITVGDIGSVRVTGLDGVAYADSAGDH